MQFFRFLLQFRRRFHPLTRLAPACSTTCVAGLPLYAGLSPIPLTPTSQRSACDVQRPTPAQLLPAAAPPGRLRPSPLWQRALLPLPCAGWSAPTAATVGSPPCSPRARVVVRRRVPRHPCRRAKARHHAFVCSPPRWHHAFSALHWYRHRWVLSLCCGTALVTNAPGSLCCRQNRCTPLVAWRPSQVHRHPLQPCDGMTRLQ